ncbi:MAG: HPr family phosphocarrier protein [Candidatus Borkfalkiaceae bacterium]|nr:HPr family phosphocarrier protein [Christensenellaceae bacterium]
MKSVQISLQMASQVKTFVSIVQKYSYDIDLRSDRYVVDAKSILGIFSLDLTKPLSVEIHSENCDDLLTELKQFEK